MSPIKKFVWLRLVEWLLIVSGVVWAGGLTAVYFTKGLTNTELILGVSILVVILAVGRFIQRGVDRRCLVALAQSNYAHDDAFAALFERSPVAYLIIDNTGRIMETNPAAIKLLQSEAGLILKTNFFDHIDASEDVDPTVLRGKVQAGMTLTDVEVPLHTVTNETIWVLFSTFAYRSGGERLIALSDVTEQKHMDTAKSEFVALATHQLRTPIAAIRWNVELLEKSLASTVTEAQARYLLKVQRNIIRMTNLINDFLSVSKLEMGTYATSERELHLSSFFTSIVDEFAGKIAEKQIDLVRTEDPSPVVIKADDHLFHIIVSNLVSNAVKYLHPNGRIELSYRLSNTTLTIIVADNGIGIPEGELDKLFTKFYRASNAQSHQTEGTGLGLYIVKQSVELLGGTIEVAAKENAGARFIITLPVTVVSVG